MTLPTLTAPGAVLRPLEIADAEALHAAHSDPETHHFWGSPAHKTLQQTREYVAETIAIPNSYVWAITENGREALGRVALFKLREGVGEFGIIMRREATGRGLASRAIKLVEDYAFNELGMHRLTADIDPDNNASMSLFLRAGFQREGVLRGNWKTHLGIRDSIIVGKLKAN